LLLVLHSIMSSIKLSTKYLGYKSDNNIIKQGRCSDMQKTKIIFLTTGLNYGGAETQLVHLASRLKKRGWNVQVISMIPPVAYVEELERAGIPVYSLEMRRGVPDPRGLFRLVKILRREGPQILTTFMYHANLLGRLGGKIAGVPIIISSIRNENFGGPTRDKIMRLTDWMADVTVINSRLAGETVVKRGVVPPKKLRVIPNGLEIDKFSWTLEQRLNARKALEINSTKTFLWIAIGRLEKQKDYSNLLEAFSIVLREKPDTFLFIVGQGPLENKLKKLAEELGINQKVSFLGLRRDIPDLLAAADALVLSSAWEGLPNVVMEAMAASKPIVATSVGGVPELILEGKTGYLVPPKDPKALAQAMLKLMDLPESARETMGQLGRKYIEESYSLERVVDMWEELYIEFLKNKRILDKNKFEIN